MSKPQDARILTPSFEKIDAHVRCRGRPDSRVRVSADEVDVARRASVRISREADPRTCRARTSKRADGAYMHDGSSGKDLAETGGGGCGGRSGALAGVSSFLISKILPSRRVAKARGQRYHLAGVRRCARHTLRDELIVRRDVHKLKFFIPDYAPARLTILHVRIQKRQNQSAITVRSDLPSREKSARSSRAHAGLATPSRRPILAPCEFCAFRSVCCSPPSDLRSHLASSA